MASGLVLVEEQLTGVSETRRLEILLQWLKQLPETISTSTKTELKEKLKKVTSQLLKLLESSLPPALRCFLARSLVAVFSAGDYSRLLETVNKCNDIIKSRDEMPATKLTALQCLEALFRSHGRMAGSSFLDILQTLIKSWKVVEYRCNILQCLESILFGLGSSASSVHKDVCKVLKNGLTDKFLPVRVAASKCAVELSRISLILYTQELDVMSQTCLKSFEGSSYDVRCSVAYLWGSLLATTQKPLPTHYKGKVKLPSLEDCLTILSNGFIKGAGGFLKTGGTELLKGGIASREVRVGVAQAYVFFFAEMGGVWLERHLPLILSHLLELLTNPKTTSTHVDTVYSRKCVGFIIRHSFRKLLGEAAQLSAATHLCTLMSSKSSVLLSQGNSVQGELGESKERDKLAALQQHAIVCGLSQVGSLVVALNTAAQPLLVTSGDGEVVGGDNPAPLIKVLNSVLMHHSLAVRLSAAGTVFCVGSALPLLVTPLVDYCIKGLRVNRGNPEGLVGFANGLSAVLSSTQFNELGIPSAKAIDIFKLGEEFVQTPFDGGKLSLANIQSGWALIGAYLSLGPSYIRANLRNVIGLWHKVFPHSRQELAAEMKTESSAWWKHTLEMRNGALTSIVVFASSCKSLLSHEILKRVMLPLDSALAMTTGIGSQLVKTHGIHLKGASAMLRLRLYQAFLHLPENSYEGCLNTLIEEVVTEFTLSDNLASTTTSLLRSVCHQDDSILLGSWLEETDHHEVEEMLQPNSAAGSGTLEHDPASTYLYANKGGTLPEPLPLGVAVIDSSVSLFGHVFHQLSCKHRKQLLTHFKECIRQAKPSNRQQAIQINIFSAFLAGLRGLVENKVSLGDDGSVVSTAYSLIAEALSSPDPMLRCAGGEALGRLSQAIGEPSFVAQVVQMSVDSFKRGRDINSKTGHILSLGCLHRYVGGMGSGQHLHQSVSALQELATDSSSTTGQVWGLHALSLIADSGGPLFRNHVDSTLHLLLNLLINTPTMHNQMYRCLGNCLSALLTTLGPELQIGSRTMIQLRDCCLICYSIVQAHPDPVVKSAVISCLQQLQLFAPTLVSLEAEVPILCSSLESQHLLLRRSAANCLRQFSQQEPKRVWEIVQQHQAAAAGKEEERCGDVKGLEQIVLSKLDTETDDKLRFDLKEILFSLLSSLAPSDPMKWLLLCNGVLSATAKTEQVKNEQEPSSQSQGQVEDGDGGGEEDEEMSAKFTSGEDKPIHTNITPRWPTKVFAVECSRKVYSVCKNTPAHFDLPLAQKKQAEDGGDFLVMHLSELVKTSFIAATASVDHLKLEGYKALQDVIRFFSGTVDPEYPDHVLLEQYQAQIGAALRPAFTSEAAPHVTAMACQVCGEWLGSGVSRDISDLKRVQQLLVSSLDKLHHVGSSPSMYGDAVATMESLAVLKAWAELYIKVSHNDSTQTNELVATHLLTLSKYWLLALKDYAFLNLPLQFNSQLPSSGGTFYNPLIIDFVKPYYQSNWASLLNAVAISISRSNMIQSDHPRDDVPTPAFAGTVPLGTGIAPPPTDERHNTFHLVLGVAVQSLCNSSVYDSLHDVQCCLNTINELINSSFSREVLLNEEQLVIEILDLLHRILLTVSSNSSILLTLSIAKSLADSVASIKNTKVSQSLLTVAAYCLFKFIPHLAPSAPPPTTGTSPVRRDTLVSSSLALLPLVSSLHPSPADVLPLLFYLTLAAINFLGHSSLPTALQTFKSLCSSVLPDDCSHILHSALASLLQETDSQFPDIPLQTKLLLTSVILTTGEMPEQKLFEQWTVFCRSCLLTEDDAKLQATTLQVCETLFMSPKQVFGFSCIHNLGPDIVEYVQKWSRTHPTGQAKVVIKATGVLEYLLKATPDEKKHDMMRLILPLFISLLVTGPLKHRSSDEQQIVHTHVLKTLVNIGPLYPTAFKSILSSAPELKVKLETAIKSSKDTKKPVSKPGLAPKSQQQPTIKLKMDFSNFK